MSHLITFTIGLLAASCGLVSAQLDLSCDPGSGLNGGKTNNISLAKCKACEAGTFGPGGVTLCSPCVNSTFSRKNSTACSDCISPYRLVCFDDNGIKTFANCTSGAVACFNPKPGMIAADAALPQRGHRPPLGHERPPKGEAKLHPPPKKKPTKSKHSPPHSLSAKAPPKPASYP